MMKVSLQQALEKYHALYDNGAYNAIRTKVIADLFGKEANIDLHSQDTQVTDLMNNLIDACFECYGSGQHIGAHIWLAKSAVWVKLENETINLMHAYLATFQSTIAEDFQATAKALMYVYQAK